MKRLVLVYKMTVKNVRNNSFDVGYEVVSKPITWDEFSK